MSNDDDNLIKHEILKNNIFIFLSMLFVSLDITSSCLAYKFVSFGVLLLPVAVFIYSITYTIADIITECYGYRKARLIVWIDLFCALLFSSIVYLALLLPSPPSWHHQAAYDYVLGNLLRLEIAAIFSIIVGGFVNIYLLSKWKILLSGKYFWFRSIMSTVAGEVIYLLITIPIAFYGITSFHDTIKLIYSILIIKIIYSMPLSFVAYLIIIPMKKKLKIDTYDTGVKYDLFSLET